MRPYYTPGLGNGNYTVVPDAQAVATSYYNNNEFDDLIDSKAAARELINFTVLKYLTTAVSSPFEVSKTLLQVQYMPREDAEVTSIARTTTTIDDEDDHSETEERMVTRNSVEEEGEWEGKSRVNLSIPFVLHSTSLRIQRMISTKSMIRDAEDAIQQEAIL